MSALWNVCAKLAMSKGRDHPLRLAPTLPRRHVMTSVNSRTLAQT